MSLPYPPCQAWTSEETDWCDLPPSLLLTTYYLLPTTYYSLPTTYYLLRRDFPPSCDCLAECHALNHRVPYVAWCVNTTRLPLLALDAPKAKELEQAWHS